VKPRRNVTCDQGLSFLLVSRNSSMVFMMPLKVDPFVSNHSMPVKVSAAISSKTFF